MVIFGTGLNISLNYIFSIAVFYYIYEEYIIFLLENRKRRFSAISLKKNVYHKCNSDIWNKVCPLIDLLLDTLIVQ